MKPSPSFFDEVWMVAITQYHNFGVNRRPFVGLAVVLAAVIYPSSLQADPVVALDRGKRLINCGTMLEKGIGQRAHGCSAVFDSGNLISKSSLELNSSHTQSGAAITPQGKAMNAISNQPAAENRDKSANDWWFYFFLPLPVLVAVFYQPNVRDKRPASAGPATRGSDLD